MTSRMAWAASLCLMASSAGATDLSDQARDAGRVLFMEGAVPACAVCHTLADANAQGMIGPSLDTLKPDASRVEKVLRNGLGVMPAYDSLTDEQIKTLSEYVAQAASGG